LSSKKGKIMKNGAKALVIIGTAVTAATTVFLGGSRIGKTEAAVEATRKQVDKVEVRVDTQDLTMAAIKEEQAYQKGVVNTKLENLKKGQQAIIEKLDGR
jgi:hypothetical protein